MGVLIKVLQLCFFMNIPVSKSMLTNYECNLMKLQWLRIIVEEAWHECVLWSITQLMQLQSTANLNKFSCAINFLCSLDFLLIVIKLFTQSGAYNPTLRNICRHALEVYLIWSCIICASAILYSLWFRPSISCWIILISCKQPLAAVPSLVFSSPAGSSSIMTFTLERVSLITWAELLSVL